MVMARRLGISECKPRSRSTLGWFNGYDGNIIGGTMLGIGMTLTGACPGTVLVQVATGIRSGYAALAGGLLGGLLYIHIGPHLRKPIVTSEKKQGQDEKPQTLFKYFSIKEYNAVLAFELACLVAILGSPYIKPNVTHMLLHPIVGGLLIGGAQAATLALTGNPVGVSTAYEQISHGIEQLLSSIFRTKTERKATPLGSVYFATGILAGSYILSSVIPIPLPGGEVPINTIRAVLGGVLMVFGARLAGGCTSGHGISGMSTLSVSSIITVASIFAGGMGLSALL